MSWCRVDVFLICVLCRCVGSLWFCVLDLCWCVSLVLWCKCVHSFYINNRLSILAWCDVDAFIAFFCGEYWVGCLVFFYQTSGRGLYLRLTDGCLFFGFVYFCISVGVGFLRWIKLRLVPCFFVIKTIHNMVGFGCVLWVFCGRRFLCVENAVYKIYFIYSV